jgi:DNA-binding response OmpR family regulator
VESRTRVLAVEDDEDTAEALRQLLEMFGYDARTVIPAAAEAAAEQFSPACVLLHLGHPNHPWTPLIHKLHAIDPELPIIGLTGWRVGEFQRLVGQNGLVAVLNKPVEISELFKLLPPTKPEAAPPAAAAAPAASDPPGGAA